MFPRLLPIFVSVDGAVVAVTGDGPVAQDVAARLRELGAEVRAIDGATQLDGVALLVAASGDPNADEASLSAARGRGVLAISAFSGDGRAFLGACEQRDGIAVAATTCGRSPELEARLAARAAGGIGEHDDRFASILAAIRGKLEDRIPDATLRNAIWQQILDSPVLLLLQAGQDDDAVEMAERMAWGTG